MIQSIKLLSVDLTGLTLWLLSYFLIVYRYISLTLPIQRRWCFGTHACLIFKFTSRQTVCPLFGQHLYLNFQTCFLYEQSMPHKLSVNISSNEFSIIQVFCEVSLILLISNKYLSRCRAVHHFIINFNEVAERIGVSLIPVFLLQEPTPDPFASPLQLKKALEWELSLDTRDLRSHAWYHGAIPRSRAEEIIENEGDFLIRDCASQPGNYVLSCMSKTQYLHFVINKVCSMYLLIKALLGLVVKCTYYNHWPVVVLQNNA